MKTPPILEAVSVFDPAIDYAATGRAKLEEYAGRWDAREGVWASLGSRERALLTMRPGATPTVFHVGLISMTGMRWVRRGENLDDQRERAFCTGVTRIDGLVDDAGRLMASREPQMPVDAAVAEHWWRLNDLDELRGEGAIDYATILEIGGVALTRAGLRRGSGPQYLLPLISADAWAALVSRLAATPTTTALQSSDELGDRQTS